MASAGVASVVTAGSGVGVMDEAGSGGGDDVESDTSSWRAGAQRPRVWHKGPHVLRGSKGTEKPVFTGVF